MAGQPGDELDDESTERSSGSAAGFVLFVWLIRTYSAARVNVFVFLSPVFGLLIAWLVLGEPISLLQAGGALAVAAGIWVVNSGV